MKTRIVIHCSAGPQTQTARQIVDYHLRPANKGGRGWRVAGYHYIVSPDGTVTATVDEHLVANGARGFNRESIHICYIGGVDEKGRPCDNRTAAQKASIRRLVSEIRQRHPIRDICGHRDLSPDRNGDGVVSADEWLKACPCFDVRKEFRAD